jgi:hydrogenase maturation protease
MALNLLNEYPDVELLTDFQLQVEHTLDMVGRELILFIDASVTSAAPFEFHPLERTTPRSATSYTSHELTPDELLKTYLSVHHQAAPPSFLLSIAGEQFELGAPLSESAQQHLQLALQWVKKLLRQPTEQDWLNLSREAAEVAA